jgi:hypothetical protein
MRLGNNLSMNIKFQLQEILVISGVVSHGLWESQGLGITLITLGILGAIFRAGFEVSEKKEIAEAKQEETEKIRNATSALSEAFSGLGSSRRGES